MSLETQKCVRQGTTYIVSRLVSKHGLFKNNWFDPRSDIVSSSFHIYNNLNRSGLHTYLPLKYKMGTLLCDRPLVR